MAFICPTSPQWVPESPTGTSSPALLLLQLTPAALAAPRGYRYSLCSSGTVHPSCSIPLPRKTRSAREGTGSVQEDPATPEQGTELRPSPVQHISTFSYSKMSTTAFPARPAPMGFTSLAGTCKSAALRFPPCSQCKPGQPPTLAQESPAPGQVRTSVAPAASFQPRRAWRPVVALCLSFCLKNKQLSSRRPGSFGCRILSQPQLYSGKSEIKGLCHHAVGYCRNNYCYINDRDQLML